MASTIDKIKDKVAQVTHTGPYSDKTHDAHGNPITHGGAVGSHNTTNTGLTGTHNSGLTGTHNTGLTGTHNTGLTGNQHTGTTGLTGSHVGSTNAGPHDSNIANKLDPRVDSDRDGSRIAPGAPGYGVHTGNESNTGYGHNTGLGNSGSNTGYGTSTGYNTTTGSTNAGPHNSNLLNKLDPRVDSDRDGSRIAPGAPGYGVHTGNESNTGYGHNTTGAHTGIGGTTGSTNAGPHNSNLLNKLDPRVDSDRDGSATAGNTGYGNTTTGYGQNTTGYGQNTTGYGQNTTGAHTGLGGNTGSTNAGPHSSNLLNKLDPRVDSDLDGSNRVGGNNAGAYGTNTGTHTGAHTGIGHDSSYTGGQYGNTGVGGPVGGSGFSSGPGPAPNTAGPHSSNLLNKVDPRVDSNLDGSNTYGGNATYQS